MLLLQHWNHELLLYPFDVYVVLLVLLALFEQQFLLESTV